MRVYVVQRRDRHRGYESKSLVAIHEDEAQAEKDAKDLACKHAADYFVEVWRTEKRSVRDD